MRSAFRARMMAGALAGAMALTTAKAESAAPDLEAYLRQHHYGDIVTNYERGSNAQTVEVEINGKTAHLRVDTGAMMTVLSAPCAERLNLKVRSTKESAIGVGGVVKNLGFSAIRSFKIGHVEINHLSIIAVMPMGGNFDDGLLGLDVLKLNDVILPVGGRGFLIKPGATPVAPIDAFMRQMEFTPVPLTFSKMRLKVSGLVDGKALHAIIDTGASYTAFDSQFLSRYLNGRSGMIGFAVGVDGRNNVIGSFTPRKMMLGSFEIPSSTFTTTKSFGLEIEKVDALIGYDLLASHRAVIDIGSNTLWLR